MGHNNKCASPKGFSVAWLFVSLVILSSLCSLLLPSITNAASAYDGNYQTIHPLVLRSGTCPNRDISTNWVGQLSSADQTSLTAAFANGGSWGVSSREHQDDAGNINMIDVYWNDTTTMSLDWTSYPPNVVTTANHHAIFRMERVGGDCVIHNYTTATDDLVTVTYPNSTYNYFFNGNPNLPAGYEGIIPPATPTPPKTDVKPEITYTVDQRHINASYSGNQSPFGENVKFKLYWAITNNDGSLTYKSATQASDQSFAFDTPSYDHYKIFVKYVSMTSADGPYAPIDTDKYNLIDRYVSVYVNGTSFTAGTKDTTCTTGGTGFEQCAEFSPYVDCSTFGTDLIGGFGCVMTNVGIFFRGMLTTLFVPSSFFLNNFFTETTTFFTTKFGFLAQSVSTIFGFLTSMIAGATTPNAVLSPAGTYFGQAVHFDFSSMKNIVGDSNWNLILLMIRSITSVAVLFGLYRTYALMIAEGKD